MSLLLLRMIIWAACNMVFLRGFSRWSRCAFCVQVASGIVNVYCLNKGLIRDSAVTPWNVEHAKAEMGKSDDEAKFSGVGFVALHGGGSTAGGARPIQDQPDWRLRSSTVGRSKRLS
jgi:hypothetical protein